MQKIEVNPIKFVRNWNWSNVLALQSNDGTTSGGVVIPVCDTPEEYEGLRLSLYSSVGSDFFIDNGLKFICEQTGFDQKKNEERELVEQLVSKGFDITCQGAYIDEAKYLFLNRALSNLVEFAQNNENRLFNTQVGLATQQGVKSNKYVFLQEFDQKFGSGFYDEHGVLDEYTRYGGKWYWHPENFPYRCAQILSEDLIIVLAQAVGQDPKTFINGVWGEIAPQMRGKDMSDQKAYYGKKAEKMLKEACVGKTYGELLLTAMGEYLAKMKTQFPEINESYDVNLREIMKHYQNGGLVLENCFAVVDEDRIIAIASSDKVAKEIAKNRGLTEAEIMSATDALKQIKNTQKQRI